MDYKRIIKSQRLRFRILNALRWVPDSVMLRLQYRIKMGFWPDFKHPKRFTEKLQLYKMKYRNPVMSQCVDKYEVRRYVEDKGLGHILNDIYGVYDSIDDIDFSSLPNKFVVKSTTGGGGLNVIVVKDKSTCNWDNLKHEVMSWSRHKKGAISHGREWAYTGMADTRILVEKLLESPAGEGNLVDYKFFCFDGEPQYLYVITDRKPGEYAYLSMYDKDFNKLPYYTSDERKLQRELPRPKNFEGMIEAARKLSEDFPHVRVDLYDIDGKVVFGELTFYDGSGYYLFEPDDFDEKAGSYFTEYS